MLKIVAALGVVREESAILAAYLTMVSRLTRRRCISLLRRGAPASGKNFLIEQVLNLMPEESVVCFNSSSPQSLIYHGQQNPNSLKHKIVWLPEASSTIAEKKGVESEFTSMLRQLISDNRVSRGVAVPQKNGPPVTIMVVKNGPIAVLITSARNDVEAELLTRLLFADSDESKKQTQLVVDSQLATAAGTPWITRPTKGEVEEWRDFQRWLEADGPYDVNVPFAAAIKAAMALPTDVRLRRDISGLIAAVSASAVVHKAMRETDAKGRIVATIEDYSHAFDAFAPGMGAVYRPSLSRGVIALVKAIEKLIAAERKRIEDAKKAFLAEAKAKANAERRPYDPTKVILPMDLTFDGAVRATHKQIKAALGLASDKVVATRIQDALTASVIERTNPNAARSEGARYRVLIPSTDLKKSAGVPVFPTPNMVKAIMDNPTKFAAAEIELAAAGELTDDGEDDEADEDEAKDDGAPY
jgi:hypothetical protein